MKKANVLSWDSNPRPCDPRRSTILASFSSILCALVKWLSSRTYAQVPLLEEVSFFMVWFDPDLPVLHIHLNNTGPTARLTARCYRARIAFMLISFCKAANFYRIIDTLLTLPLCHWATMPAIHPQVIATHGHFQAWAPAQSGVNCFTIFRDLEIWAIIWNFGQAWHAICTIHLQS